MNSGISKIWIGLLILVAFLAGVFSHAFGSSELSKVEELTDKQPGSSGLVSFEPYWKAWNVLNSKFVDPDKVTSQDKLWGSIEGLAKSYEDPYTIFLPPEDSKIFEEDISGNFEGVGMEIGIRDETLTVIAPLKGTPADNAGIRPGDKILEIDGDSTLNFSVDDAVKKIRGEGGTKVDLTILHQDSQNPQEISIVRDVIEIPTLETETHNDVFVIKLFNFNINASELFRDALQEFVDSGHDKLILDLRNNPGGFLAKAVDVSSWFLSAGKVVVIEDFGDDEEQKIHRSKGFDVFNQNLKMVVLVNQGSASASEIVAGALSEHGIAILIGAQTFGKGSVQELVEITNDTALKVTVAKWLTPEGKSISEGGLVPDIEVPMTFEDYESGLDPQLDRAFEYLRS